MHRTWLALVFASCLAASATARADVSGPPNPAFQTPPPPVPAEPTPPPRSGGAFAAKPVVAGIIAIVFLVFGGVAANDKKKRGPNSMRPSSRRAPPV